ncbi:sensor histidine kinase [Catalinimonas alkaloidigena]|nr:HAMP domain-containing sensor histidine kinase [Catalinimonas alkaloidigena]
MNADRLFRTTPASVLTTDRHVCTASLLGGVAFCLMMGWLLTTPLLMLSIAWSGLLIGGTAWLSYCGRLTSARLLLIVGALLVMVGGNFGLGYQATTGYYCILVLLAIGFLFEWQHLLTVIGLLVATLGCFGAIEAAAWQSALANVPFAERLPVWLTVGGTAFLSLHTLRRRHQQAEAFRAATTALHQTQQAKDKLYALLAHDLRSGLGNVQTLATLLSDYAPQLVEGEQEELLTELKRTALATHHLCNDMLEWSRGQQQGWRIYREPVALASWADDQIALQRLSATQKHLELRTKIDPALVWETDVRMLATVVRNLVQNAIKFTPRGGAISLEVEHTPEAQTLWVCDNGVGIAADRLSCLFEAGHHQGTYGTDGERGSGLGLVLCHALVVRMGGTLQVESEPGRGSRFGICLPHSAR